MTSPAELVHYLDNLGITLWEEGGGLKFRAPAGALTPELAERLRREKPNLIAYLATQQVAAERPETLLASPMSLVRDMLAGLLQVDRSEIGEHDSLGDLGVDSVIGVALIQQLNQRLGLELQATVLFDTVTAANLADRLNSEMAFRHPEDATPALAPAEDAICQGLLFSSPGTIEQMGFADLAIPTPVAGEVRVRVYASGINFADLLCLRGLYPTLPDYPFIPGFEIAGVVDAVGAGVSRFRPGEPVFGVTGAALGGHAQFATVDQRLLIHTLPGWSFSEAAATPVAFLSAMVALYDIAELKPNQTVLIHAAAGGVGFAAVQLASLRQARVIGTSSSADKREWLQQAGISAVDYSDSGFAQTVLDLTDGRGVDVVIDTLAGQVLRPSLELVAAGGCYIQLAVAGQRSAEPLPLNLFHANQSFHALDLRRRALAQPDWLADALSRLAKLLADASLRPVFSAVAAEQVNEALHALDNRATIGKLVLTWPQPDDLALLPAPTTESPVELATPPPLVQPSGTSSDEKIAIIGMSAHLPGSPDLESLWKNLVEGRDLIQEIPPNRWDWRAWYGASDDGPRTQAKWGGFLSDIDAFDADFFGISRPEAELMDPRQRMFVEHVWTAIEHAGYDPNQLAGSDTGVFVGVGATDYFERLRPDQIEAHTTTGCFLSIMANRISYMFDLHGPSEPVDTACSSSLVAVHNAVNALRAGTCSMAIAGSTHLLLSPKIQLALSKSGMMSPDGRCKTFDSRADGYVRGEGVGALLLRPLAAAEAAGDPIHGLVLATAVNHGGRANSLTAPNPNAQADLLVEAYQKAGVDPETVTFIETHGTGTALGDPVEINALKRAFDKLYGAWDKTVAKTPHIALGAVKSNLGHLEISAGLAGIFKLLLSMKHHQRPANVHLQELNPLIDLRHTPFRILRDSEPWPQESFPHRAGVSSFGFGGVNAHVVLEEYRGPQSATHLAGQRLLVLSAKTTQALSAYAAQLAAFLSQASDTDLTQLAWTLQVGRQPMKHRIAFAVESCAEAVLRLNRFADGSQTSDPTPPREPALAAAAANFLAGKQVKWSKLYVGSPLPKRIALPTYPFQRDRFWLLEDQPLPESSSKHAPTLGAAIDVNISNLEGVRFAKCWTLDSFVLADHIVAENPVLPGVAYLEMALAAADLASAQPITQLSDIIWARPMTYTGQPLECTITLERDDQRLEARVLSPQGHVHAEVSLNSDAVASIGALDLQAIGQRCPDHITADAFYRRLASMNLNYQAAFQPVRKVSYNAGEVLGQLSLPEPQVADFHRFRLHPSLIDGALQTVSCFLSDEQLQAGMTFLPFSLEAVRLIAPLTREVYVYARPSAQAEHSGVSVVEAPMDVSICDTTGKLLIILEGFTNKILGPTQERRDKRQNPLEPAVQRENILAPEAAQIHCFAVSMRPEAPGTAIETGQLLVFDQDASTLQSHRTLLADAILVTPGPFYSQLDEHHYQVSEDEADLGLLFTDLERNGHWPQTLCHLGLGLDAKRALLQLFLIGKTLVSQNDDRPLRLLSVVDAHINARADAAARFAFLRTLAQEAPNIAVRLLCAPNHAQNFATALDCELKTAWQGPAWIFHDSEGRKRQLLTPVPASLPGTPTALYRNGVALITGGMGGLGLLMAQYLGTRTGARIALIGRARYQDAVQGNHLTRLRQAGVTAIYVEADVARADEMTAAVARIEAELGPINAVFHCAGLNRDGLLFNKPQDDFEAVLAPKLEGTLVLDQVTAKMPLDCFVMFSSIAGAMGNPGQADYAAANGFMDGFSAYRDHLVTSGQRQGRTLSINWPLWLNGGMSLSKEHQAAITARTGLEPLDTEAGINALLLALAQNQSQLLTAPGRRDLIAAYLDQGAILESVPMPVPKSKAAAPVAPTPAATYLTGLFGQVLKKERQSLELNAPFQDFGVDSFLTLKVIKLLEKDFGRLPKTLLFENHNITELDAWLRKNHADTYANLSPQVAAAPASAPVAPAMSAPLQKQAPPAPQAPSLAAVAQAPEHSQGSGHMPSLRQKLATVLKKSPQSLDPDQSFQDLGIDSFLTLKVIKNLEKEFGSLPKTLLFENHNLRQLSDWFDARYGHANLATVPTPEISNPALPKVQALKPAAAPMAPAPVLEKSTPSNDLRTNLRASLAAVLKKDPADIDADAAFQDYGVDSFLTLKLIKALEKDHGRLPKTLLFENHNLRQLGDWLQKHKAPALEVPSSSDESLQTPQQAAPEVEAPVAPPREVNTYKRTQALLAQLLKREPDTIAADQTFQSLGLDSLLSLKLIKLLEKEHGSLPKTLLFENHDLKHLVDWLERQGVHYQPIVPSQGVDHLDRVRQAVAYVLQRPGERLDNGLAFHEFGVDSFHTLKIIKHLEKEYGQLPKTLLFENHSIQQLASWLEGNFAQVPTKQAAQIETNSLALAVAGEPMIVAVEELPLVPELAATIAAILDQHAREGSISRGTPEIAPFLFIDPERRCYFNFTLYSSVVLIYAYTGPDHLQEGLIDLALSWCRKYDFQLNFFEEKPFERIGTTRFSATPFGVMQRVHDVANFQLAGNKMRRLRYLVQKFEQLGNCRTEHYQPGSDSAKDRAITVVIDAWCGQKTQINPLIYKVRDELMAGQLGAQHRIYLTWLDETLCNAILITRLNQGRTWLMDLEFYGPEMPLGGLEFAIVNIIQHLAAEGMHTYSLGGTYGPFHQGSPNEDPGLRALLDEMRDRDDFGKGNVQFKNKFRTSNNNIYLCRPEGADPGTVMDILMMIADPVSMREQPPDLLTLRTLPGKPRSPEAARPRLQSRDEHVGDSVEACAKRLNHLSAAAYNVHRLPQDQVDFDLQTDSWAQLNHGGLQARMAHLAAQSDPLLSAEQLLGSLLQKQFVVLTDSGRNAEALLMRHWQGSTGEVPQNLLFPSGLFHQIDQGFLPLELPDAKVFDLNHAHPFKGELDLEQLKRHLDRHAETTAFVCIELCDNAAGGGAVSLAHLAAVKDLLRLYQVRLVVDATRLLENAALVHRYEHRNEPTELWPTAAKLLSDADIVVGSLAKDFSVNTGGFIATHDEALYKVLNAALEDSDRELAAKNKHLIARSLAEADTLCSQVLRRMAHTRQLHQHLHQQGVAVALPGEAHCILIDPRLVPKAASLPLPGPALAAGLYHHTGIRIGQHSAGMQKGTSLNGILRLAVPVGLSDADLTAICTRLERFFGNLPELPALIKAGQTSAVFGGEIDAPLMLKP